MRLINSYLPFSYLTFSLSSLTTLLQLGVFCHDEESLKSTSLTHVTMTKVSKAILFLTHFVQLYS